MDRSDVWRTALLVVASVGALGVLVAGMVLGGSPEPGPGQPEPSSAPTRSVQGPQSQDALFSCPELAPVFTRHVPPIMNIQEERATAAAVEAASGDGWSVAFAEPTRLGVMAFVDGDLEAARPVLEELGARHVWERDAGSQFEDGYDRDGLVTQALYWLLQQPMEEVLGTLSALPHDGEAAFWTEAGAILVQWKAPLPARVAALYGMRPDGVLVVVEETAYSPREITAAVDRIFAAHERGEIPAQLTSGGSCGDFSGVLIGIEPTSLGDRGPELQEQLARIAGLPVHVIPQEPARAM